MITIAPPLTRAEKRILVVLVVWIAALIVAINATEKHYANAAQAAWNQERNAK